MKSVPERYSYTGEHLSGGQGDVYIYRDKNLDRKVAIKFVSYVVDTDDLIKEISALQSIRSDHVVGIYDLIFSSENELGLVEEFLPGVDLLAEVQSGQAKSLTSSIKFIKLAFQIATGIHEIHSHGIIHRDIKLNNMKYDAEGMVKIFDFGLAKMGEMSAKTKGFKGTYGFAAPELFGGAEDTVILSKAADVYGFGICAWMLATGEIPPSLLKVPPEKHSEMLSDYRKDLEGAVCDLIDECLSYKASDRPSMKVITSELSKRLTQGRHRGTLSALGNAYEISAMKKGVNIKLGSKGSAKINYDDRDFFIEPLSGYVAINGEKIEEKRKLPGACVIAFGDDVRIREFCTFDISHPEVII